MGKEGIRKTQYFNFDAYCKLVSRIGMTNFNDPEAYAQGMADMELLHKYIRDCAYYANLQVLAEVYAAMNSLSYGTSFVHKPLREPLCENYEDAKYIVYRASCGMNQLARIYGVPNISLCDYGASPNAIVDQITAFCHEIASTIFESHLR